MENLNKTVEELKKMRLSYLNMENFKHVADEDRYYNYLYNYVLGHVTDDAKVFDSIIERPNYSGNYELNGVFDKYGKITCIVPERKTLLDEMVCIHEITRLVNILSNINNDDSIYRETIPYFNEYEYLKQIHQFYATYYEKYRMNTSIQAANKINDKNKKACLTYIVAHLALRKRMNDYNIDSLNKTNATTKKLERDLKLKGYTI